MKLLIVTLVLASLAVHSNAVGPLSVQGNKILINGKPGALHGNSLFWSNTGWGNEQFFNADVVNWLKNDWKSNVIRVSMGIDTSGGYFSDPNGNKNRLMAVVDAAIKADIYVIIDWQSFHAHLQQSQAIAFFQEMARKYGTFNNVIYEIFNEPESAVNWKTQIKPYALAVIKAIRDIDPDNLIIVGTPFWSQNVDIAASDPITGFANIAYTLHFYAGTQKQELRDRVTIALQKNIALFVTEWGVGNVQGNGNPDFNEANIWIKFVDQNGISTCNWSIGTKAESNNSLKPGASPRGGWTANDLTASGTFVRNLLRSY